MTCRVLHLSDLHFGYDKDETARKQREKALAGLVRVAAELKPQVLAISGDLTWQGKPEGYTALKQWLNRRLFPATGLKGANCVLCAGNHDVERDEVLDIPSPKTGEGADKLLTAERMGKGCWLGFQGFEKFAKGLRVPAMTLTQKQKTALVGVRECQGLRFVTVNSAWFCRDSVKDNGSLWLGRPLLDVMDLMEPAEFDSAPVTIALMHHPSGWLAEAERTTYGDRRDGFSYLTERVHAVLSGHTHGMRKRPTQYESRAWLFQGGAAYDSPGYRNNFTLLEVDDQRVIEARGWEYDPRTEAWREEEERHVCPLAAPKAMGRQRKANPENYVAWLRRETSSINLHQLKVAPGEVPPPSIDTLYIRLRTHGRADAVELDAMLREPRLVVEGKPGSGKTTFLRHVAWLLCRPEGPPAELPVEDRVPVFLRISLLDDFIAKRMGRKERPAGEPSLATDPAWITHYLASQERWGLDESYWRGRLQEPGTLLLLDGLDEAANTRRRKEIVALIRQVAESPCRVVVTTRPGVHEGRATLEGFALARIEDLDAAGVEGFLRQWCRWLKRGDEAAAADYFRELRPAVDVPGIRYLARNPLMLTTLAVLYLRRHRLPEERAKLYEEILDWLAEQAVDKHREYTKEMLLNRFAALALLMQEWPGGQKIQIGLDTAAERLASDDGARAKMRVFLEKAQVDSGILTLRGGEIAFWHRSFQEYLAARALSGFNDANLAKRARKFLYSAEGSEVLPLLAGRMAESAKERLDDLMIVLVKDAAARKRVKDRAHAVGVLGAMEEDVRPLKYVVPAAVARPYADLRRSVMCIFDRGGAARKLGLKTRVDAAEALDRASQRRLLTPDREGYWVSFAGGTFTMGDPEAYQSVEVRRVTVKPFRMGRCPVTVWEYQQYLEATESPVPGKWDEQRKHPGRPVVRVDQAMAMAYCRWANADLPTDEQWEFAARGEAGRIYPWGEAAPDEHKANFESRVGEPTPVGLFPEGETPEGLLDLAGNVWEWTRSEFEKGRYSVRGACFYNDAFDLRAAVRVRDEPGWRGVNLGFRCVRE